MCGGTTLPVVPAPAPTPPWLQHDPDIFFTPVDFLVSGVLLDRQRTVEDTLDQLREFYRVHGERPLLDALDHVTGKLGYRLDPRVERVAEKLRTDQGVAA